MHSSLNSGLNIKNRQNFGKLLFKQELRLEFPLHILRLKTKFCEHLNQKALLKDLSEVKTLAGYAR